MIGLFSSPPSFNQTRKMLARIFLLTGSLLPGIFLIIDPQTWGSSPVFVQMSHLPIVNLTFFGVCLILAGILILFNRLREIGYVWTAMFYLVANISAGFAIYHGHANSALIFTLPIILWLYLEAAITATRGELDLPTAFTEVTVDEKEGDSE